MLDANQLTKRAYRPSLKSYFVLTEVGACQSYNLRLTYVDGEVLMVNLQPLIASTKALYPLKNADPFVKAKLEKNAAKQTLDQLHERRKQVVRLHKKGITIMPIAAMTGLIYPKEPPTAKRGIPRCAKPLWWWVGSRLLRTWPGLKKREVQLSNGQHARRVAFVCNRCWVPAICCCMGMMARPCRACSASKTP